jgi:hypothetical protein
MSIQRKDIDPKYFTESRLIGTTGSGSVSLYKINSCESRGATTPKCEYNLSTGACMNSADYYVVFTHCGTTTFYCTNCYILITKLHQLYNAENDKFKNRTSTRDI